MEATDRTTGHVFLENVATGEFRWKDPAVKKAGGSALDASGIIGGGMPLEQKVTIPSTRPGAAVTMFALAPFSMVRPTGGSGSQLHRPRQLRRPLRVHTCAVPCCFQIPHMEQVVMGRSMRFSRNPQSLR